MTSTRNSRTGWWVYWNCLDEPILMTGPKTIADWVWNSSQIGGLWKPCNWLVIEWASTPPYQTRQFSSLIIFSTSSSITFSRPNSFTQPTGAEVCSAPKTTFWSVLKRISIHQYYPTVILLQLTALNNCPLEEGTIPDQCHNEIKTQGYRAVLVSSSKT